MKVSPKLQKSTIIFDGKIGVTQNQCQNCEKEQRGCKHKPKDDYKSLEKVFGLSIHKLSTIDESDRVIGLTFEKILKLLG